MYRRLCAIGVLAAIFPIASAAHAAITFTKIVDENTPIPGGGGFFWGFGSPSMGNGNVMFRGYTLASNHDLYVANGGLTLIAGLNTPIPGGTGNFTSISSTSFDGNDVVFYGLGSSEQKGIYSTFGGLHAIADKNTPFPGGGTILSFTSDLSMDGEAAAFVAHSTTEAKALFLDVDGVGLSVIMDDNTVMPGSTETFDGFGNASVSGQNVAFSGNDTSNHDGAYAQIGGTLLVAADTNTPVPEGIGNFTNIGNDPSMSGERVAFQARGVAGEGIYTYYQGTINVVADLTTLLPNGSTFQELGGYELSLDGENVAFFGTTALGKEIYAYFNQTLVKIIAPGDVLDGRIVSLLSMDKEALHGGDLAFHVRFSNDEVGIYVAHIPEPSALATLAACAYHCSTPDCPSNYMCLDLPQASRGGPLPIEPRINAGVGAGHQLQIGLTGAAVGGVTVDTSCTDGSTPVPISLVEAVPGTLTVIFDPPLPNGECCELVLSGGATGTAMIQILEGDVNQNGIVNATDKNLVKGKIGRTLDAENFVFDVNMTGTINATDKFLVKAEIGEVVAVCP